MTELTALSSRIGRAIATSSAFMFHRVVQRNY